MEQQRKWQEMTAAASGTDVMALQAMMFQNPILLQQQQYVWEQMAQQQVCVCGGSVIAKRDRCVCICMCEVCLV